MDSERRHELETNDLREFFDNFKDFWDKHGNRLLITLIVVLGGWLAYDRYNKYQAEQAQAAYAELNQADSADAFRQIASEHSRVHDEAMRRGADTALGQARTATIAADHELAQKHLNTALAAYTALADRGETIEYQLVGYEGLAKVADMRIALASDDTAKQALWDEVAKHYQSIIDLAGETFINHADRAQRALDRIDLLKKPIAFALPEVAEPAPISPPGDLPTEAPTEGTALPPLPLPTPAPNNE